MKKEFFKILYKESSTKSFHIVEPLIEILYLVLVSFNLGFKESNVDDLVEQKWEIPSKIPLKTRRKCFCMNFMHKHSNAWRRNLRSETIFDNWKLFKNYEKCFLFHVKSSFILKTFWFLSWLFRHLEKTAWLER